jgi:hypothetical protein
MLPEQITTIHLSQNNHPFGYSCPSMQLDGHVPPGTLFATSYIWESDTSGLGHG